MGKAANDFRNGGVRALTKAQLIYEGSVARALRGIKFGDSLTGAPGQPVESGELRNAWEAVVVSPTETVIRVNPESEALAWAQQNEDGIARPGGGPYVQRSEKGGRRSVALTAAGFPDIVRAIAEGLRE